MEQGRQQQTTAKSVSKPKADSPVRLGQTLETYMADVSPKYTRFSQVENAWNQLLPDELLSHCRIAEISRGKLKIKVDLPAYIYELKLCSSDLLEQIKQLCPQAGIKQIVFSPGKINTEKR